MAKTKIFYGFFILFIFILIINCEDKIVSECDEQIIILADSKMTFEDIQNDIFNVNCVSCHSGNPPAGDLDLSAQVAYENLVDVESTSYGYKRVVPDNAEASLLYLVLEGEQVSLMPPQGKLSGAYIDSVASWINRGAEKD